MALNIRKITLETIYVNLLVYGDPGVGKTTLAATAQDSPAMSPVLIASAESGNLSIAGRGDIDEVPISSMLELEELAWAVAHADKSVRQYKTIVLDSGTELAAMSLQEAVDRDRTRKGVTSTRTADMYEIQNYGESNNQMKRLTRMFRDLPVHVIMTALPKRTYPRNVKVNADTEPVSVSVEFSPKLATAILGFMDFCHYMYKSDDESRHLLTQERGIYFAKSRGARFSEAIGAVIDNPTMPFFYERLLETEGTAPKRLEKPA
jgi:hypothetical protein